MVIACLILEDDGSALQLHLFVSEALWISFYSFVYCHLAQVSWKHRQRVLNRVTLSERSVEISFTIVDKEDLRVVWDSGQLIKHITE